MQNNGGQKKQKKGQSWTRKKKWWSSKKWGIVCIIKKQVWGQHAQGSWTFPWTVRCQTLKDIGKQGDRIEKRLNWTHVCHQRDHLKPSGLKESFCHCSQSNQRFFHDQTGRKWRTLCMCQRVPMGTGNARTALWQDFSCRACQKDRRMQWQQERRALWKGVWPVASLCFHCWRQCNERRQFEWWFRQMPLGTTNALRT